LRKFPCISPIENTIRIPIGYLLSVLSHVLGYTHCCYAMSLFRGITAVAGCKFGWSPAIRALSSWSSLAYEQQKLLIIGSAIYDSMIRYIRTFPINVAAYHKLQRLK